MIFLITFILFGCGNQDRPKQSSPPNASVDKMPQSAVTPKPKLEENFFPHEKVYQCKDTFNWSCKPPVPTWCYDLCISDGIIALCYPNLEICKESKL